MLTWSGVLEWLPFAGAHFVDHSIYITELPARLYEGIYLWLEGKLETWRSLTGTCGSTFLKRKVERSSTPRHNVFLWEAWREGPLIFTPEPTHTHHTHTRVHAHTCTHIHHRCQYTTSPSPYMAPLVRNLAERRRIYLFNPLGMRDNFWKRILFFPPPTYLAPSSIRDYGWSNGLSANPNRGRVPPEKCENMGWTSTNIFHKRAKNQGETFSLGWKTQTNMNGKKNREDRGAKKIVSNAKL